MYAMCMGCSYLGNRFRGTPVPNLDVPENNLLWFIAGK